MGLTTGAFHQGKSEIRILVRQFLCVLRSVSSLYAPALIAVVLVVSSGCGGGTSPSGPAAVRSIEDGKAIGISHSAALHAILVVDTNASGSVSEALERDLEHMTALVDSIAAYTGMRLNKQVFSGSRATKAMMDQAVETLSVEDDDAVLFYFSGHGGRTEHTETQWPDMYLHNAFALNLSEVFDRLNSKGGRLLLALSDSCNGFLGESSDGVSVPRASHAEGYRKLFLESQAAIIVSSSEAGELSYMQSGGSVFTRKFLQALSTEVSSTEPDWTDLMQSATRQIRVADVQQHPQYLMY